MRIRVRLQPLKGHLPLPPGVEASGLVNSGFEAHRPEVIIPIRVAALLGLWPDPPAGTAVVSYDTAGGPTDLYRLQEGASVTPVTPDHQRGSVLTDVVIHPQEREVLLSQPLGARLEIVLELGRGTWRFEDEPDTHRPPEPRQLW